MSTKFDRIVLAVTDLPVAVAQYQQFFGRPPVSGRTQQGELCAWWGLSNTVIELAQCTVGEARLQAIVFSSLDAGRREISVSNSLGLDIRLGDGRATTDFRQREVAAQCAELSVDHVVLRTDDAQACIDLFAGELEVRLALDKTVPQWGGRMLFFRAGKLTLEVIESAEAKSATTTFWGLAYQCHNLQDFVDKLGARGVVASGIREGRKPGTLVATLKSHSLGIPTLLIQPAK